MHTRKKLKMFNDLSLLNGDIFNNISLRIKILLSFLILVLYQHITLKIFGKKVHLGPLYVPGRSNSKIR